MGLALTILIDGLTYASWLFIVALGLTLVFGVLKILNIAHGSFYAWAPMRRRASSAGSRALEVGAGAVARRHAARRRRGRRAGGAAHSSAACCASSTAATRCCCVLVTYALFLILEDVTKLVWGANPYYVSEPYALFGNVRSSACSPTSATTSCWSALAVVVRRRGLVGLNRTRRARSCWP